MVHPFLFGGPKYTYFEADSAGNEKYLEISAIPDIYAPQPSGDPV